MRAAYKELHPGGQYAKGKGREADAWRKLIYPSSLWVPIYNAKGSRQDAAFDGSMSLFANWNMNLDFLHTLVNVPKGDNKLELFLWRLLCVASRNVKIQFSPHHPLAVCCVYGVRNFPPRCEKSEERTPVRAVYTRGATRAPRGA